MTYFDPRLLTTHNQKNVPEDKRILEVYSRINLKPVSGTVETYTGHTSLTAKARFGVDLSKANNPSSREYDRKICKALRHAGPENFKVMLLAKTKCKSAAIVLEEFFMQKYDTLDNGLNGSTLSTKTIQEHLHKADLSTVELCDDEFRQQYFPHLPKTTLKCITE